MTRLLIGCDPELFLRDKKTKQIVSAHTLLPGTKLEPFKVPHGAIQVDGAAAEFNTDPADTFSKFVMNIRQVMTNLKERLPDHEFVLEPTATFDPTYFKSLPDDVRELGCNPDFNAYTGQVNPPPDGESTTMRTASGHIHVGWCKNVNPLDDIHFDECRLVIRQLDYYVGLYTLLWDRDEKRRNLYGKAGAFRPKPYGVEYRTPSNVWLRTESIQSWIYNATTKATNDLLSGTKPLFDTFGEFAKEAIDTNNYKWHETAQGKKVYTTIGLSFPEYQSCLDFYKPKAEYERKKATLKKLDPNFIYKFKDIA